jgi:hypothetical protein
MRPDGQASPQAGADAGHTHPDDRSRGKFLAIMQGPDRTSESEFGHAI